MHLCSVMKRGVVLPWIFLLLVLLFCAMFTFATTFLPQTLDDLDQKADYVILGTVQQQQSNPEGKAIVTATTVEVDEILKGPRYPQTLVIKEKGGQTGDVVMIVPGSPTFEEGEKVALFFAEEKPSPLSGEVSGNRQAAQQLSPQMLVGHTVGMAQGKFSIVNKDGTETLINDLEGGHLLADSNTQTITLAAFRERYHPPFWSSVVFWFLKVFA